VIRVARLRPTHRVFWLSMAAALGLAVVIVLFGMVLPANGPLPWLSIAEMIGVFSTALAGVGALSLLWIHGVVRQKAREAASALEKIHAQFQEEAKNQTDSTVAALRTMVLGRNDDIIAQAVVQQNTRSMQLDYHIQALEQHASIVEEYPMGTRNEASLRDADVDPGKSVHVQPAYFWHSGEAASTTVLYLGNSQIPESTDDTVRQAIRRLAGLKSVKATVQ